MIQPRSPLHPHLPAPPWTLPDLQRRALGLKAGRGHVPGSFTFFSDEQDPRSCPRSTTVDAWEGSRPFTSFLCSSNNITRSPPLLYAAQKLVKSVLCEFQARCLILPATVPETPGSALTLISFSIPRLTQASVRRSFRESSCFFPTDGFLPCLCSQGSRSCLPLSAVLNTGRALQTWFIPLSECRDHTSGSLFNAKSLNLFQTYLTKRL